MYIVDVNADIFVVDVMTVDPDVADVVKKLKNCCLFFVVVCTYVLV